MISKLTQQTLRAVAFPLSYIALERNIWVGQTLDFVQGLEDMVISRFGGIPSGMSLKLDAVVATRGIDDQQCVLDFEEHERGTYNDHLRQLVTLFR
jgi:hypothetical protein